MAIEIVFPLDGDMLNEFDGVVRDGKLYVQVRINASAGNKLSVNGVRAEGSEGTYTAEIGLENTRNTIEAVDEETGGKASCVVYWLKNATNKYRLSVDDNIWFLRDIAQNSGKYRSIFDNPYLRVYKELHDTYGTKVHLNLFYQTDGFDLSQMPDHYKDEWRANSDWLRLTFHSLQEHPGKPYKDAEPDKIMSDCEKVTGEIVRFAGEELLSPVTTIHFGEATRECSKALRSFGFRALAGYFRFLDGKPSVSYYLDDARTAHIGKRDFWKDHDTDLVFAKIDLVLDRVKLDEIVPSLERIRANPHESGFLELMIHEQYFYQDYTAYQSDFREKLFTAVEWATEHGYKPAFLSECLPDEV